MEIRVPKFLYDEFNKFSNIEYELEWILGYANRRIFGIKDFKSISYECEQVSFIGTNGACHLSYYSGEALITKEQNTDLAYVVPEEGSNFWFNAVAIPTTTQNKELAEKFINFLYRPDIAKLSADYSGYSTPNKAVFDLLDTEVQDDPAAYPSTETISKCEIFQCIGTEGDALYLSEWQKIKGE